MKRNLLFTLLFCLMALFSMAQHAPGTVIQENITGLDVNSDEAVDVQQWLAEGKFVLIDIWATWCPPCWTFHQSGYLDELNEKYGPEGTDQLRILGIEADSDTPTSYIFEESGTSGTFDYSFGDWTTNASTGEQINYNLIEGVTGFIRHEDDGTYSIPVNGALQTITPEEALEITSLSNAFLPTLYMLNPDGYIVDVGEIGGRTEEALIVDMMNGNIRSNGSIATSADCFDVNFDGASVNVINLTDGELTDATVEISANGSLIDTYSYSGDPVLPFQTLTIDVTDVQQFNENVTFEANVTSVNGVAGDYGSFDAMESKYEVVTETMTVFFTTDHYPAESSWSVSDQDGNVLLEVDDYVAGPEAYGGGGADADRTHEYTLEITGDVSCLRFNIEDSFGDGMSAWFDQNFQIYNINNVPGLEVVDQWGNIVKDNDFTRNTAGQITGLTGEGYDFDNELDIFVNAEMSTGVEAITELEGSKVYPNPVAETLNVELNFTEVTDYSVSIIDIYGKTVRSLGTYSNTQLSTNYNVEDLASGMYMITIQSDQGQNVMKFTKS